MRIIILNFAKNDLDTSIACSDVTLLNERLSDLIPETPVFNEPADCGHGKHLSPIVNSSLGSYTEGKCYVFRNPVVLKSSGYCVKTPIANSDVPTFTFTSLL